MATPSEKPAAKKPATTRRKTTTRKPAAKRTTVAKKADDLTIDELEAVLAKKKAVEAKKAEDERIAREGMEPTKDLDWLKELEERPAPEPDQARLLGTPPGPPQTAPTTTPEPPTFYVRNLRNVPVSYRLGRQKSGERRTDLKPRGSRGDISRVEAGDLQDPVLKDQAAYGLIEIITEKEALLALDKQVINQQARPHPALSEIRNQNGEAYANDAVVVEQEAGAQGFVVGNVDTSPARISAKSPITRPGDQQANAVAPLPTAPVSLDEQARDAQIRANKRGEGIEAGLGGLTVAPIAPVQTN